jgi:hypothetical protein
VSAAADKVGVLVTQAQFDALESAWSICAYGNTRRAKGMWVEHFEDAVSLVLGYLPPNPFYLVVKEPRHV